MRQSRTIFSMVALAGYLLTVIVALPLHRCDHRRSEALGAAASGGCTHCCVDVGSTRLAVDAGTSSLLAVWAGGHDPGNCYFCHVLAQKSLPTTLAAGLGWDEVGAEIPCVAPCSPTLLRHFSWSARAPPRLA